MIIKIMKKIVYLSLFVILILSSCTSTKKVATVTKDYEVETMGVGKDGKETQLTVENIRQFFFSILEGRITVRDMDGKFDIKEISGAMA